ncbi:MAG: hydrogenase, partial [Candidatus Omnitrophica bacterium]|nr:hydrogenase [Candidatus Omnitrophota bacterium]
MMPRPSDAAHEKNAGMALEQRPPKGYGTLLLAALALLVVFHAALAVLWVKGIGIWGVNIPVGWGISIVFF